MGKLGILLLLSIAAGAQQVTPQASPNQADEYRAGVEELNQRYMDFFARDEDLKRYYKAINQGIPEFKAERQKDQQEAKRAVQEYRQERRPKPDTAALEAEHDAEGRALAKEQERNRKDYVQERAQLKRISDSARKIPENRDAGLE